MTSRHHQRAFQRGGTLLPRGHRPQYPPEGQRTALTHGRDGLVSGVAAGGPVVIAWRRDPIDVS